MEKYCNCIAVLFYGAVDRSRTGDLLLRLHLYLALYERIRGLDCILSVLFKATLPLSVVRPPKAGRSQPVRVVDRYSGFTIGFP